MSGDLFNTAEKRLYMTLDERKRFLKAGRGLSARLRAIVVDLDVCHVRHQLVEVQLRLRIALPDFLFRNRMPA